MQIMAASAKLALDPPSDVVALLQGAMMARMSDMPQQDFTLCMWAGGIQRWLEPRLVRRIKKRLTLMETALFDSNGSPADSPAAM